MQSRTLDALCGARLRFKCENLQRVGAFKFRGASNALLSLPGQALQRGVATHSSGNHAAALACAAGEMGVPAYVVMPHTAPLVKQRAVAAYGATIFPCEPTLAAREAGLAEVVAATGAVVVHPFNDPAVIAGQGTAALELLEDAGPLDLIVVPVGGGGLAAGTALAVAARSPHTRVMAAEPEGADDAFRSLRDGVLYPSREPKTVADGLRTSLGELTFTLLRRHRVAVVTVSEAAIVAAMRLVWERLKLVIEPSAAVAVAAVLERKVAAAGQVVGVILSGGNVDLDALPWR
jgi:threonine dehydratase